MIKLKPKSAKEQASRLFIHFVLLLMILIIIFSFAIAEDDNTTSNDNRTGEQGYSNTIAITILIVIIAAVAIYAAVDYAANKKHMQRAKAVARKAKIIVKEAEQEEEKDKEQEIEIEKKATQRKKILQKDIEERRRIRLKSKKQNIISEFEEEKEEMIKPNPAVLKRLKKKKVKTFISLHDLGKHKNIKKRKPKQKVNKDKNLFDKLEELGE